MPADAGAAKISSSAMAPPNARLRFIFPSPVCAGRTWMGHRGMGVQVRRRVHPDSRATVWLVVGKLESTMSKKFRCSEWPYV